MAQRTVYLAAGDLATIEELAAAAPRVIDKATFYRYALILGAYVMDQAFKEIKPDVLGPLALKALLKTSTGRRLIKISAATEEMLEEEPTTD